MNNKNRCNTHYSYNTKQNSMHFYFHDPRTPPHSSKYKHEQFKVTFTETGKNGMMLNDILELYKFRYACSIGHVCCKRFNHIIK